MRWSTTWSAWRRITDWPRRLAEGVSSVDGLDIDLDSVESNIVYFGVAATESRSAKDVVAALAERGVTIGALGPRRLRAVTHLDVNEAAVDGALAALREVMAAAAARSVPAG